MTKRALIIHGTACSSESYWIPWLKDKLERDLFLVDAPDFPDAGDYADLNQWVSIFDEIDAATEYDLIIAHSAGVPFVLRLLSNGRVAAKRCIFVAGFITPLGRERDDRLNPAFFDDAEIKKKGGHFVFIHSDNDPWGCDHIQGEKMRQRFGGTLVIQTGEGHFGSDVMNQPYKQFPMLLMHCAME